MKDVSYRGVQYDTAELKIKEAKSFLLRVPVRALQVDSQSTLKAWDVIATTDVNNRWDLQTALKCAPGLGDVSLQHKRAIDLCKHAQLEGVWTRNHENNSR